MDNKGFTLIELLATIVVLAIVVGISIVVINFDFDKSKEKTEEVFVDTIKDAMDMYLDSDGKKLSFGASACGTLSKTHGIVNVYKTTTTFQAVIDSKYHPITQSDLVNPANEDVDCADANSISVDVYKDDDGIYYYSIVKSSFACLKNDNTLKDDGTRYSSIITNLPEGFSC